MKDHFDEDRSEDQILQMLYYDSVDISKRIDPTKSNKSRERMFVTIGFLIMDSNFKIMYIIIVVI